MASSPSSIFLMIYTAHPWLFVRNAHGCLLLCLLCWSPQATAHGGVVLEDDLCVIQIGFFKAHFTIYQPQTRTNQGFCEDIPDVAESVFVLDYLHNSLQDMPVDFRIITDVKNLGRFAKWEDVVQIKDIDRETVFYQPPIKRPDGVFSVVHKFAEPGSYIGIVTTKHPTKDKTYNAVFPFRVGGTGYGYLPLFVVLMVLVQLSYWMMAGDFSRRRAQRFISNSRTRLNYLFIKEINS